MNASGGKGPRRSGDAYAALRHGAAIVERADSGRLLITGADRRSYLQGLLTNDIAALGPNTGCYAVMLTAQGRMLTDMRVFELRDSMLVELPAAVASSIRDHLDRFVFSEDVQVADVSATRAQVGVYGPDAARVVSAVTSHDAGALAPFASLATPVDGAAVLVARSDAIGIDGYELFVDGAAADALHRALAGAGAVPADAAAVEAVRIESGRPLFGVDMDADTIPLEANLQDRAISRTKGCYVGQEVIIRVIDRGHGRVARRLVGLTLDAASTSPSRGTTILSGNREVGLVTSAVLSPSLNRPIALGYVHRDFTAAGTSVAVGGSPAVVTDLPFV